MLRFMLNNNLLEVIAKMITIAQPVAVILIYLRKNSFQTFFKILK